VIAQELPHEGRKQKTMPATSEEAIRRKRETWNKTRRKSPLKGRSAGNSPGNNMIKALTEAETIAHTGYHTPMNRILTNPADPAGQAIFKKYPVSDFIGITERAVKELFVQMQAETEQAEQEVQNISKADAILFKRIKGYQFPDTTQDDDDDDGGELGFYNERP